MNAVWSRHVGDRHIEVRASIKADGDFHLDQLNDASMSGEFEARRRSFVDLPWSMAAEEHGVGVVHVDHPGAGDGAPGDVLVTTCAGAVLGCWAGDCAPVVLVGADTAIGVAHAGWRGLAAGVLDVAIAALGEPVAFGILGPCIGPCCNEFGADDLQLVAAGVHADPTLITRPFAGPFTGRGSGAGEYTTVALDVPRAVRHVIEANGAAFEQIGACTGCQYDGFSHRVRADRARHVVAAWQRPSAELSVGSDGG